MTIIPLRRPIGDKRLSDYFHSSLKYRSPKALLFWNQLDVDWIHMKLMRIGGHALLSIHEVSRIHRSVSKLCLKYCLPKHLTMFEVLTRGRGGKARKGLWNKELGRGTPPWGTHWNGLKCYQTLSLPLRGLSSCARQRCVGSIVTFSNWMKSVC